MVGQKTRRDNGSGHIYQRENGTWVGRVYQGLNENGGKTYKNFSGKSQGEVKRKIKEWLQQGTPEEAKAITLEDYIKMWLVTYKYPNLKRSAYDALEKTSKNHVIPALGCLQIQSVTAKDIQDFLTAMINHPYSYSMVKKAYDLLNAVFKKATASDVVVKNPMLLVEKPSSTNFDKEEMRIFTKQECALLTEECTREYKTGKLVYQYADAYILILQTGMRMGEAIGLRKEDWDKENKVLHIRRNMQSVQKRDSAGKAVTGKEIVQNSTKTYSGSRNIPLTKIATETLTRLCEAHPESEWIIADSKGHIVPPDRLEHTFYRILRNVNIKATGVHTLRHTFASMLFAAGKNVAEVSKLLGHANISITYNTYIHLIEELNHDTVTPLEDI